MSIGRINSQPYINAYNSNSSKAVDKVSKTKDVDRIEISELAKSLKDSSIGTEIVNTTKVADIKSKIDAGTYSIDAKMTAKSMLNSMKESNV